MMASILLLYSIGTLAVPVTMIQYNSQSPLECDGCKWIVSKAQDYLKNNEARLDNITEVAVESNICNHLPPKDIDLCDKLVLKYIPVALDSLVEKISDPTFVCTEVVPLCSDAMIFQNSENRVKTPTTIDACSKSFRVFYDYLESNTKNDIINKSFNMCKRDNIDKVLACEVVSQHVANAAVSIFNDDVDICKLHVFEHDASHGRRILESVDADIEDSDFEDEDDEDEVEADVEADYDDDDDDDEVLDKENESEPDEGDNDDNDNESDDPDDSDNDNESDDDGDGDGDGEDEDENAGSRRLLRFKIKISNPFKSKSSPPPPPKPAPAPAPKAAPAPKPAPPPKHAPAPAPKAAPAPKPAPPPKPAHAPKAAPAPAPKATAKPVILLKAVAAPPTVVPSVTPAPKPVAVTIKTSSSASAVSSSSKSKKKSGFLKKGLSFVKKAVPVVAKTAVKVAKAASPVIVPAVSLIPGSTIPLTLVNKVAPKVVNAVKKVAPKVKKVVSKIKDYKAKISKSSTSSSSTKLSSIVSKVKAELPNLKAKVNNTVSKIKPVVSKVSNIKKNLTKVKVKNAADKLKNKIKGAVKKVGTKLKKAIPKINGVKIYGNFCGPNYCGGEKFKGAEGPNCRWGVSPKDSLDSCCKLHDQCCGNASSRGKHCNKEVLECAKKASCSGTSCTLAKAAITAAFTVGKNKVCGDFLRKGSSKKPNTPPTSIDGKSKSSSSSLVSPQPKSSTKTIVKNKGSVHVASSLLKGKTTDTIPEPTSEKSTTNTNSDTDTDTVASSESTTQSSVSDEIKDSIPAAMSKLATVREKLVSIINEMNAKDKTLETENKGNYEKVEKDVEMEQLRIEANRKILTDLNTKITSLNVTIQTHYKTLIAESEYIKRLDAIRPGFLKSLQELSSHIDSVKTVVDSNIVKDEYKDEMIDLLNGVSLNARNISGFVATAFINHYNKYKNMMTQVDASYEKSIQELTNLSSEYKEKQVKMLELQRERSKLEAILSKLKNTLTISANNQKEFDTVLKQVLDLFDEKNRSDKCKCN
jgi:septal ring factor EnvC (AmiA/AmiB activator)